MRIVFLSWVLLTSACCSGLKNAVADHSKSVRQLTQASLAALPPCKEGKPQACEIVQSNLQAIDASAAELKKLSE